MQKTRDVPFAFFLGAICGVDWGGNEGDRVSGERICFYLGLGWIAREKEETKHRMRPSEVEGNRKRPVPLLGRP